MRLTDVETVADACDSWGSALRADETEEPVRGCGSRRPFGPHGKAIDLCLVDPRYHAPSTTKRSVVEEKESNRHATPLGEMSVNGITLYKGIHAYLGRGFRQKCDSNGYHYIREELQP